MEIYPKTILLTGVTGTLGRELLPRLINCYVGSSIYVLIRESAHKSSIERLKHLLQLSGVAESLSGKVVPLCGDVRNKNLGLNDEDYEALLSQVDVVFHLAANISFTAGIEDARRSNVIGACEIAKFSELSKRRDGVRINYVSTAYVAGKMIGKITENDRDRSSGFWNTYEQSKFEAENVLINSGVNAGLTIFRPSIIVGDSSTGKIGKFFAFYDFLKIVSHGHQIDLWSNKNVRPDLIPIDFVCNSIVALSLADESIGKTFHLAAGLNNSLSLESLVKIIIDVADSRGGDHKHRPARKTLNTSIKSVMNCDGSFLPGRATKAMMNIYEPYLNGDRDFDVESTMNHLSRLGVQLPDISESVRKSILYAMNANFMDVAI